MANFAAQSVTGTPFSMVIPTTTRHSPARREITQDYEKDGEPLVDIELTRTRQTGEVAVRAWATFIREAR